MLKFVILSNINQMLHIFEQSANAKQSANGNLALLLYVELSMQTTQIGIIIVSIDKAVHYSIQIYRRVFLMCRFANTLLKTSSSICTITSINSMSS